MAQKIQIILIDDLDGTSAQETVTFGLDSTSYEIDLNVENVEKLREAFAPWVQHARRIGRVQATRRRGPSAAAGTSANTIRQWARDNGYPVNARGRIAANIREAYEAAN